jgi:1-hydroxycarotenoid 3,4-desaturase
MTRIAIIGSGIGGLSAALDLAAEGHEVTVFEKEAAPGGKMREVGPARIAGGPTVFTMGWVFEELFEAAGLRLSDYVRLTPLDVLARHAWDANGTFDLHAGPARATEAVGAFFGAAEARNYTAFLGETASIYRTLERSFLAAPRPSPISLSARIGFHRIGALLALKPLSTLYGALARRFRDPRLVQLFARYATYTGASPFKAPATLMLIAHVEQAGVSLVEGGILRLAEALRRAAEAKGAVFRLGAGVARIETHGGRASGLVLDSGERHAANVVIANADSHALASGLFGDSAQGAVAPTPRAARSLSACVWTATGQASGFPLAHHNVVFSRGYRAEFDAIFGRGESPAEPTVYVCAQDRGHGADAPSTERFQILTNAPAHGDTTPYGEKERARCRTAMMEQLARCGLTLTLESETLTAPPDFARLFPATGGAIYGRANHGMWAPFRRPGSRTRLPGLYLAGGGSHPGAGVPMAALSGRLAAQSVRVDLVSTRTSRPAAISGGISTRSATTGVTR